MDITNKYDLIYHYEAADSDGEAQKILQDYLNQRAGVFKYIESNHGDQEIAFKVAYWGHGWTGVEEIQEYFEGYTQ